MRKYAVDTGLPEELDTWLKSRDMMVSVYENYGCRFDWQRYNVVLTKETPNSGETWEKTYKLSEATLHNFIDVVAGTNESEIGIASSLSTISFARELAEIDAEIIIKDLAALSTFLYKTYPKEAEQETGVLLCPKVYERKVELDNYCARYYNDLDDVIKTYFKTIGTIDELSNFIGGGSYFSNAEEEIESTLMQMSEDLLREYAMEYLPRLKAEEIKGHKQEVPEHEDR